MLVEPMRRPLLFLLVCGATFSGFLACGSRTGLLVPDEGVADAGHDAKKDVSVDARPDSIPQIDASKRDSSKNDCPDADSTFIYVVTDTNELLAFYPPDASFKKVGLLTCSAKGGATPYSMGVDRKGVAYVTYTNGQLFKVSTKDAACAPTAFVEQQTNFETFGMGFATKGVGPEEDLYIASATSAFLGKVDVTSTFAITSVGEFDPLLDRAELTGTGDGRLYAFYAPSPGTSAIAEVDKGSAAVIASDPLPGVDQGNGWAFGFWGGYFWLFTSPGGKQRVTRYDPATKGTTIVGGYTSNIVGAGVSTCAPQ
ncbi:hypothetical protein BH09MYX1_BH09MYX1_27220 [soil metagenome]